MNEKKVDKNLKKYNLQKRIDQLAKKYKNKNIAVYGAGQYSQEIFSKYDLSKLNITAVFDKKFQEYENNSFQGVEAFPPVKLKKYNCDLILVLNKDFALFKSIIKEIVTNTVNSKTKIVSISKKSLIENLIIEFQVYQRIKKAKKKALYLNKIKQKIIKTAKSCGEGLWIGGESYVTPNTIIADHVNFNGMKIMGAGKVSIGRYLRSGIECLIITQNHNYDNGTAIPFDETYIHKDVEIGDFVWLGSRVMILPGTKIGEGAVIQGGSVVHGEIPPYAIAGGNPAKVFKYRNIEHFQKLKSEGKFY